MKAQIGQRETDEEKKGTKCAGAVLYLGGLGGCVVAVRHEWGTRQPS